MPLITDTTEIKNQSFIIYLEMSFSLLPDSIWHVLRKNVFIWDSLVSSGDGEDIYHTDITGRFKTRWGSSVKCRPFSMQILR